MGNQKCHPPKPIPPPPTCGPKPVSAHGQSTAAAAATAAAASGRTSIRSLSNPSLQTLNDNEIEQVELSASEQFTVDRLDEVYDTFVKSTKRTNLTSQVTKTVSNLIDSISMDDHILFIAQSFSERHANYEAFYRNFVECSEKNKMRVHQRMVFTAKEKYVMHVMYYLRFQKIILQALDDGRDERVHELLNLVALSHEIMEVNQDLFKVMQVNLVRNLLHFNILTEEQMPPLVFYSIKMIEQVTAAMEEYRNRHSLLLAGPSSTNNPCREHYRELKKWKAICLAIQKSLMKPLGQYEKQIADEQLKGEATEEVTDVERSRIVRLLKLGYKFRNKGKNFDK